LANDVIDEGFKYRKPLKRMPVVIIAQTTLLACSFVVGREPEVAGSST
jgi:hypothetical protein